MYRPLFCPNPAQRQDLFLSHTDAFCGTGACILCKFSCVLLRVDTAHLRAKYNTPAGIF